MPDRVRLEEIRLKPWIEEDLDLLRLLNAPAMTAHLRGPEFNDAVLAWYQRYQDLSGRDDGQMFRIVQVPQEVAVGSIGVWERDWQDERAWETGWGVLPEYQGRASPLL